MPLAPWSDREWLLVHEKMSPDEHKMLVNGHTHDVGTSRRRSGRWALWLCWLSACLFSPAILLRIAVDYGHNQSFEWLIVPLFGIAMVALVGSLKAYALWRYWRRVEQFMATAPGVKFIVVDDTDPYWHEIIKSRTWGKIKDTLASGVDCGEALTGKITDELGAMSETRTRRIARYGTAGLDGFHQMRALGFLHDLHCAHRDWYHSSTQPPVTT